MKASLYLMAAACIGLSAAFAQESPDQLEAHCKRQLLRVMGITKKPYSVSPIAVEAICHDPNRAKNVVQFDRYQACFETLITVPIAQRNHNTSYMSAMKLCSMDKVGDLAQKADFQQCIYEIDTVSDTMIADLCRSPSIRKQGVARCIAASNKADFPVGETMCLCQNDPNIDWKKRTHPKPKLGEPMSISDCSEKLDALTIGGQPASELKGIWKARACRYEDWRSLLRTDEYNKCLTTLQTDHDFLGGLEYCEAPSFRKPGFVSCVNAAIAQSGVRLADAACSCANSADSGSAGNKTNPGKEALQ